MAEVVKKALALLDVLDVMLPEDFAARMIRLERRYIQEETEYEERTDHPFGARRRTEEAVYCALPGLRQLLARSEGYAEDFVRRVTDAVEGRVDFWQSFLEFVEGVVRDGRLERLYVLADFEMKKIPPRMQEMIRTNKPERYEALFPLLREVLSGQASFPGVPLELHACLRGWDAASADAAERCGRLLQCLRAEVQSVASRRWYDQSGAQAADARRRAETKGRKAYEAVTNTGTGCLINMFTFIPNLLGMLLLKIRHEHLDWKMVTPDFVSGPVSHRYGTKEAVACIAHLDELLALADELAEAVAADSGRAEALDGAMRRVAEGREDFPGAFVEACRPWNAHALLPDLAREFVRRDGMNAVVQYVFGQGYGRLSQEAAPDDE